MKRIALAAAAAGIILTTVVAACGDDDSVVDDDRADTPGAGGGSATTLEVSADNSESFSTDRLEAPPGQIEIVFINEEQGVLHNFALFQSEDDVSEPLAITPLRAGPSTESVAVSLQPGEYFYHCDSHPQMQGTLDVGD